MKLPLHLTHGTRGLLLGAVLFSGSLYAPAAPLISELLADNESGLRDQDGEFEDWLEIYNPDPDPIDLGGYFLTDNELNLPKWRIPNGTVLQPGEFLVIYASGKDRAIAGSQLHTNFSLANTGEYLALVGTDGTRIVQEFTPGFPVQFNDASYGFEQTPITEEDILVDVDAACTTLVPRDNSLGITWTQTAFDDNLWTDGNVGVGYERGAGYANLISSDLEQELFNQGTSAFIRIPFTVDRRDNIIGLALDIQYDDGFIAYLNGVRITTANASSTALFDAVANSKRSDEEGMDFEAFPLSGHINRLRDGDNVLAIHLLNSAANDDNLLARPQLSAIRVTDLTIGNVAYFANPTPGSRNGTQEQLPTSEVIFSHRSQTFIDNFAITLDSTFADEVVRFTIDGSEPIATSGQYTRPIQIRESTQVRARVFGPNNAAGPVKMRSFLKLGDENLRQFTSNLPILILETWGKGDPGGSTQMDGFWAIIEPDPVTGRAAILGEFDTDTRVGLKRRGSSSFGWPKYSMTLEARDEEGFDKGITPIDMPRESDWVLSGRYQFDRALMRNDLMYELSRQTGEYATRTKFVEVIHNVGGGSLTYAGDYFGVYSLMEKIKRDDSRTPVARIDRRDSREPSVSGGYMFKKDRLDPGDAGFNVAGLGRLGWVEPKEREVTRTQSDWLVAHMNKINTAITSPNGLNRATGKHFTDYIDQHSWLRHHWLNTLAMNVDGFRLSGYYYKHRSDTNDGKVGAGPIWDFDRTLGSTDGRDNNPSQWDGSGDSSRTWSDGRYVWWGQVLAYPDFRQAHTDLWQELRTTTFSTTNINNVITDFARQIDGRDGLGDNAAGIGRSPAERNFTRWGAGSHRTEVNILRTWIRTRVGWIDRQYTPKPRFSSVAPNVVPGVATVGDQFSFISTNDVFYTTDGTDPRAPGGNPSANAIEVSGGTAITIDGTTTLTARSRSDRPEDPLTAWSGPVDSSFLMGPIAVAGKLIISEVHYAPLPPTTDDELAAGNDASDFEFIEMKNISNETLNLTEVKFAEGVAFTFTRSAITSLAPGEFVLVVCNQAAFEARYGTAHSDRIAGEFAPTRLDNAGERLHLVDGLGNTIADFRYNDRAPWPIPAGTSGVSLTLRMSTLPNPSYEVPENWGSSKQIGGTPNADEFITGFAGDAVADLDLDGYPRLIEYVLGTSDSDAHDTAGKITSSLQELEVEGLTQKFLTMTFRRDNAADDVNLIPQFSVNLENWFEGEEFVPLVSEVDQGDGTSIMTYRAFPPQQESFPNLFIRLRAELKAP